MDSALIMTRVSAQTLANKGFVELALIRMMSPARMSCASRTNKCVKRILEDCYRSSGWLAKSSSVSGWRGLPYS